MWEWVTSCVYQLIEVQVKNKAKVKTYTQDADPENRLHHSACDFPRHNHLLSPGMSCLLTDPCNKSVSLILAQPQCDPE